jgi:hypothetical protein
MTMEAVSYSLRQTVFGILKTLVVRASQNNLDLTYDVEADIPDQLIGDSLRLRQVITNLVGNAIKFTPSKATRKGHVNLCTRLLALDDHHVSLEFCVTDTGIGIAKDKLNLIFDTFCQADGSTTRVSYFVLVGDSNLLNHVVGVWWDWTGPVHFEATCVADAGEYVGGERGIEGKQVLLHDHVADQPELDGQHSCEDVAVREADDFVRRYVERQDGCGEPD